MSEIQEENALERVSDYGLTQMVQQRLMGLILNGDIVSGDRVTEMSIAERLGVSRGPVREAFRALEEGGLLVTERNRGVFVRSIRPEEAVEIQEVRAALDEMAARRAASVLSAQQIKDLQGLIADMDAAADSGLVQLFYSLNLKFHENLVRWSGNGKLLVTYQRLIIELHLYRQKGLEPAGEMHHSNVAHKDVLHQIALGNPDGAAKAMRDHTAHGRQRILLGQNNEPPTPICQSQSSKVNAKAFDKKKAR